MITRLILVSVLASILAGTAVASEIQLYNNRATWNTDRTGANADLTFTNMNFETFSGPYNTAAGLLDVVTNVRFVGFQSDNVSYDLEVLFPGFNGTRVLNQPGSTGTIIVTLPVNVRAFGVDLNGNGPFPVVVTYSTNGGFNHNGTTPGSPGFFGVRTDSPITNLVFSTGFFGTKISLDNFEVGTQAETPEVASLLAIGTGLIAMRWMRRRRPLKLA